MKNILFITTQKAPHWLESESNFANSLKEFAQNVSDNTLNLSITTLDRLEFNISSSSQSIVDSYTNSDITYYDALYLRNVYSADLQTLDLVKAVTLYAQKNKIQLIEEGDIGLPIGKTSQAMLFAQQKLSVPHTLVVGDVRRLTDMAVDTFSYPFILKASNGTMGHDNYKIDDKAMLNHVCDIADPKIIYVAQEFIPNSSDYRILDMATKRPLVIRRIGSNDSHLNNTSRGAESMLIEIENIDQKALELAYSAARLMERTVVGIDVMQDDRNGKWVLLEANVNAALSTGVFKDEKVFLFREMLKKEMKA